ncbi:RagB/SusD family nutrient uptake outer membrane protein [Cytophaga sp. FL35]|uniref:RagB/SusD family nutrient uptake outer membrane protein n=1 Tax=Cytophaga sp. FL35 TaxID=1904456 RepID=UPI001653E580|nr:RagB/SusD family nutrient uptake outer membrane protein [Cytophaga sp. FL35]MBC7000564.1 RagB/SusD family nutrient uptake outer membrane protein [Cytophaga sp. FL35]
MKSYIYKIVTFLLCIIFGYGCDSFLEEEPRDLVSPSNFFNSAAEFELAIVGLYDILKDNSLHGKIGLDRYYENGADIIGPNRVFGQVEPTQSYTISESNISAIDQGAGAPLTWQNLYAIILNANTILQELDENEVLASEEKTLFRAETLFLRSYAYYHLTNLWGDVPYYVENLPISEIQKLPRISANTIRTEVLQDLQIAEDGLLGSVSSDDLSRVTKWVASILMVKIYLIQQDWQNARDKALYIIQNSPHTLLNDYASVFDPDNEYNAENIWEIDFVKDVNRNDWVDHFTPRIRDEPKDPTKQGELSNGLAQRNEGFTGYGLAIPLPDFVNKFPMDDLRRPVNIATEYLGYELNFPYMPKMWNLDQVNSPRGNHGDNKIIFRMADVYLMAAEAENELNGPANAYQYINKVRERAYEPDKPLEGLTQNSFREAIYDERKWELGGENHRRMDLIRWGILLDVVKNTEYRVYNPASNIEPKHVLLPIPPEEFLLNPALLDSDPTNNGYR